MQKLQTVWEGALRSFPASDIENKENAKTEEEGVAKCAPVENKIKQFAQLLQAFNALTPDERSALLKALGGGAVESLQL